MPRGGKGAKVAAEPSRARERAQTAVGEVDKDVGLRIPFKTSELLSFHYCIIFIVSYNSSQRQDNAPGVSGPRRSARLRATKPAPLPKEKDRSSPRQSRQRTQRQVAPTRSRPKSYPLSKQDSTTQVQPSQKGSRQVNAKQSGTAAGKPTKKSAKVKGKSKLSEPAPSSTPDSIFGDESGQRGRRKESETQDHYQAPLPEALEERLWQLEDVGAETYTDPREEFNFKYGFLPPLDEIASHILAVLFMENSVAAKKIARIGPELQVEFKDGLIQRNVKTIPSESIDPRRQEIKSFDLNEFLQETAEQKQIYEHLWLRDKAKLRQNSKEAIFQRTLMVSLICRHFLIYGKEVNGKQLLDFSAEEPWACLPMPSGALWDAGTTGPGLDIDQKLLTQPKPDLAICFEREAVIKDSLWTKLPKATKELACFENRKSGESRIFHFLAVEAKNAVTSLDDPKALYQSLNNASQALNNFYEFFQDAGPTHRQIFFNKIRFFSVVANTQGILIRIHRATEIAQDAELADLVMPGRPEYRLVFEFREWARLIGEDGFTRERVIDVFRKMFKYAVDELGVWITAAAKDLWKNVNESVEAIHARQQAGFYRHGQPCPKTPGRNTPRPTSERPRAASIAQQLHNARLASANHSFSRESANGRSTPEANNALQYSQLSTGSTKRNRSQISIASTNSEGSQITGKRLRKATGKQKS